MVESNVCMSRKNIYDVKSTLQEVLASWAAYAEKLRSLKACFEETKKEQVTEVFAGSGHLLNCTCFFLFFHFVCRPSFSIQK